MKSLQKYETVTHTLLILGITRFPLNILDTEGYVDRYATILLSVLEQSTPSVGYFAALQAAWASREQLQQIRNDGARSLLVKNLLNSCLIASQIEEKLITDKGKSLIIPVIHSRLHRTLDLLGSLLKEPSWEYNIDEYGFLGGIYVLISNSVRYAADLSPSLLDTMALLNTKIKDPSSSVVAPLWNADGPSWNRIWNFIQLWMADIFKIHQNRSRLLHALFDPLNGYYRDIIAVAATQTLDIISGAEGSLQGHRGTNSFTSAASYHSMPDPEQSIHPDSTVAISVEDRDMFANIRLAYARIERFKTLMTSRSLVTEIGDELRTKLSEADTLLEYSVLRNLKLEVDDILERSLVKRPQQLEPALNTPT